MCGCDVGQCKSNFCFTLCRDGFTRSCRMRRPMARRTRSEAGWAGAELLLLKTYVFLFSAPHGTCCPPFMSFPELLQHDPLLQVPPPIGFATPLPFPGCRINTKASACPAFKPGMASLQCGFFSPFPLAMRMYTP